MRSDGRSATPLIRPRSEVPVRERRTLRSRICEAFDGLADRASQVVGGPWAFSLNRRGGARARRSGSAAGSAVIRAAGRRS